MLLVALVPDLLVPVPPRLVLLPLALLRPLLHVGCRSKGKGSHPVSGSPASSSVVSTHPQPRDRSSKLAFARRAEHTSDTRGQGIFLVYCFKHVTGRNVSSPNRVGTTARGAVQKQGFSGCTLFRTLCSGAACRASVPANPVHWQPRSHTAGVTRSPHAIPDVLGPVHHEPLTLPEDAPANPSMLRRLPAIAAIAAVAATIPTAVAAAPAASTATPAASTAAMSAASAAVAATSAATTTAAALGLRPRFVYHQVPTAEILSV